MRGIWQRYWFREGGRYAAAAARIAIGTSILWMLWRLREGAAGVPELKESDPYYPVGILKLLPLRPGEGTFDVVWLVAWPATLAMILGAWSRAATIASFAAALVIASYEYSFAPTWSHGDNAPLLAQLAFLGARGGDALSVDAWWRRRRGIEPPAGHPYLWSVLLAQLAVAIVMGNAAYSKLLAGGPKLAWIFSDNLRNQILVRFDLSGLPRTELAAWLIEEPARWKVAALLNVIAQLLPLAACFAIRRPVLRAVLGGAFAVETIALDLVMRFPNYHWLPLTALFIDWDWLALRLRRAPAETTEVPAGAAAPAGALARPSRAARIFVAAFVVADVVIAFWRWPKFDQKLGAYPLSAFPMFASIRARAPYGDHVPYEMLESRFEVDVEPGTPLGDDARGWIEHHPRSRPLLRNVRTADAMRDELTAFSAGLREAFPALRVRAVRGILIAIRASSYPAPAGIERVTVATLGELDAGGELRSMLGKVARGAVAPGPVGLPAPARVGYYDAGRVVDLAGDPPRRAYVVACVAACERWFVVGARR